MHIINFILGSVTMRVSGKPNDPTTTGVNDDGMAPAARRLIHEHGRARPIASVFFERNPVSSTSLNRISIL
jgi:hypothetical protein